METQKIISSIKNNIKKSIVGNDEAIDLMLISLFAGGHVLLEDVPGTGKTMLVKSLAASVSCNFGRIQFTPDLLPSDITGINFFNMKKSEFEFIPGPVFSNILLADEINRATPRTQSGLLECMEERQATIDGKTYKLASPFMVVATQNPVENMGTFPLPEAQLDRFLVKTSLGYPTVEDNVEILARFGASSEVKGADAVAEAQDILACMEAHAEIFAHRDLLRYISVLTERTRSAAGVLLGVSPRGAIALLKVAKGYALLAGRNYLLPDDVKKAAVPTLAHRLVLTGSEQLKKDAAKGIIEEILAATPVPTEAAFDRA
ncbi:MAG: MoxR family ATPase [Clostridia bacterium]|nr:MoxR family ATPase [Clostridia bacterium]